MRDVTAWQARVYASGTNGGETPVIRVLTASLQASTVRAVLAQELHDRGMGVLKSFAETDMDDSGAQRLLTLSKAYEAAASAVEYGAYAVELDGTRYEMRQATRPMATPADRAWDAEE